MGGDDGFVDDHRMKAEVVFPLREEFEDGLSDFRDVVLGVKSQRRPLPSRFERWHAREVCVGEQGEAQLRQLSGKPGRVADLQLPDDEEFRAAFLADDDAAATPAPEQGRVAGFVHDAVDAVAHQFRAFSGVAKASGQPPGASITWSISAMRRMVSVRTMTILW